MCATLLLAELYHAFFLCSFKKSKTPAGGLQYGANTEAIPSKSVSPWRGEFCAAYTGPDTGLLELDMETRTFHDLSDPTIIAGCSNWNVPREYAYGISLSLYEEDRRKLASSSEGASPTPRATIVGDPVADVFGIAARENCCVMALADGVNWGRKSRLAARCATQAVMDHVYGGESRIRASPNSSTIFQLLREAVTEKAQELILKKKATLTTLSAVVVCEMDSRPGGSGGGGEKGKEWGVFVCAVGDSPVYVYCPHTQQLIEATLGCHTSDGVRDMRMAGGVLGPSYGSSPDLANLTYAYLPVYPGDIVFAVSDGVSDNFSDKVIAGKNGDAPPAPSSSSQGQKRQNTLRSCCENIPHLTRVLNEHREHLEKNISAQTVAACLINHAVEVTESKRVLRAQCLEEDIDMKREAARNPEFAARLNAAVGKLDHASVVAYQVGQHHPY